MTNDSKPFMKLSVMLGGLFAGWTISHWASAATLVYVIVQTIVLVRDKFIRDKRGP